MTAIPALTPVIKLQRAGQSPMLITLAYIAGVYPSLLWEAPGLDIHLHNGQHHHISFANESARDQFYVQMSAHFQLISQEVIHLRSHI